MGLMDKLFSGSSGAFIGGFAQAKLDRWEAKAKQIKEEADRAGAITDQIELYKLKTKFDDDELARKNDAIAVKTYNSALAEIGNEDFVEKLKTEGKLNTPELYNSWKNVWINYSGNPIIFKNADFQNDWITNGGKIKNNKEDDVVSNLTANDGALAGQKNTSDALIKTQDIPAGVSKMQPETGVRDGSEWTLKWAKTTATSLPSSKNAYNKTTKELVFATEEDIQSNPNLVPAAAAPSDTKDDITMTDLPGVYYYQDADRAGLYFKKDQGKEIEVPLEEYKDALKANKAEDEIQNYGLYNPNNEDHIKILKNNELQSELEYAKNNDMSIQFRMINGKPVGEPTYISNEEAMVKLADRKNIVMNNIQKLMPTKFPTGEITWDETTGSMQTSFTTGSINEGKYKYFDRYTTILANKVFEQGSIPNAKKILDATQAQVEQIEIGVYGWPYDTSDVTGTVKALTKRIEDIEDLELFQNYLANEKIRENAVEINSELSTSYLKNVAEELITAIRKQRIKDNIFLQ